MTLTPGSVLFLGGEVLVHIVRDLNDGRVIIRVGSDTQVVDVNSLSATEL